MDSQIDYFANTSSQLEKLQHDHQLRLDQVLRWLTNLQRLIQAHGKL